jgi:hypothetical protein
LEGIEITPNSHLFGDFLDKLQIETGVLDDSTPSNTPVNRAVDQNP